MNAALRNVRRPGRWAAALGLLASFVFAAERDAIVTMSPFEVSANTVKFERWIKVTSPHFVIYTDVGATEAMTIAREMETLHLAAQQFFGRAALCRAPMTFVLPATGSDWRSLESKGSVEWRVAFSNPTRRVVDLGIAHYDWQGQGLGLVWAAQGNFECRWLGLPRTMWFARGVRRFFETADFTKDGVALGRNSARMLSMRSQKWLPWDRFFQVTESSPEYRQQALINRYDGQCGIFMQFMLANPDPAWVQRVITWAALLEAGREPSEAEFQRVFKVDWNSWQKTMDQYSSGGTYRIQQLQFKPEALRFEIMQVAAPPREMRELFVLGQILNQKTAASTQSLDALLAKGLQTESLREILVEACLKWERDSAVDEQLGRLVKANTTNPEVYALSAQRAFSRVVKEVSPGARLGNEAAEIEQLCLRALALEPRHVEANNTLALVLALSAEPKPVAIKALEQVYRVLDGNASTSTVVSALAIAHSRAGNSAAAQEIARILLDSTFSDTRARRIARQILGQPLSPEEATLATDPDGPSVP